MHKNCLLTTTTLLIVATAFLSSFFASQTRITAQGPERPAAQMLRWGNQYFPFPAWQASVEERNDRVIGLWNYTPYQALIYHVRYYQTSAYSLRQILTLADDNWVVVILRNYARPQIQQRCIIQNHLLVEATGSTSNQPYLLRYWMWSDSSSLADLFAAYPADQARDLEAMAAKVFGRAARCPAASETF